MPNGRRFRVRFERFQWVAAPFPSQICIYHLCIVK
jgi:hypothetical protein